MNEELLNRLPSNGLTVKNVKYYKTKIKGALSRVMRAFRRRLEQEKKAFTGMRYLLLKRDEKLTGHESDSLAQFLKKFPFFKKYRALSLRISDIYHLPPSALTDSIITGITLWDGVGADLQAAVKTLKKNVREIFNFLRVFPKNTPESLYKKVRTSPEHVMRKIKDVVRTRFGLRTSEQSQLYLEQQLKCHVIIVLRTAIKMSRNHSSSTKNSNSSVTKIN
ncbi:MAG: transposase [Candidatus Helarchaeota archaeon]